MKYRVTFHYEYEGLFRTSNTLQDNLASANRQMEANEKHDPHLETLREVIDYRDMYWSDQFGYSVAKEFSSKAYGSTHVATGEVIDLKLKLPELVVLGTSAAIYLFDPEKQVWYD